MGMFGGGFSHGLGIDDATTGRGSGGYGEVGGRSFGGYLSDNSRASRQRRAARNRAAARAAAAEAARVAAEKARLAKIKEEKRVIVARDVRLAYEAATAISDNFNNSFLGSIAGFFGISKTPSPVGLGVIDTKLSVNPVNLALGLVSPALSAFSSMIGLPGKIGVPDITVVSVQGGIDSFPAGGTISGPSFGQPELTTAGLSAGNQRHSGDGSSRSVAFDPSPVALVSVFDNPAPVAAATPVQPGIPEPAATSVFSGVSEAGNGPTLASGAILGTRSLPVSGQTTEKRSVWPELITAAAVAVELS